MAYKCPTCHLSFNNQKQASCSRCRKDPLKVVAQRMMTPQKTMVDQTTLGDRFSGGDPKPE